MATALQIVSPDAGQSDEGDEARFNAAVLKSALQIVMREKNFSKRQMAEHLMLERRSFYNLFLRPRCKTLRFEALLTALAEIRAGWR